MTRRSTGLDYSSALEQQMAKIYSRLPAWNARRLPSSTGSTPRSDRDRANAMRALELLRTKLRWPGRVDSARRVLLLADRTAVALPLCRALGRAGYEVGVSGAGVREATGVSRFATRYHQLPSMHLHGRQWASALRSVITQNAYDLVVATSDAGVARLLDLKLSVPACPQLMSRHIYLIDKALLAELCSTAGVDYPMTWSPVSVEDDLITVQKVSHPCVVKAARTVVAVGDTLAVLSGASVCYTPEATLRALSALRVSGMQPVVQERLSGDKLQAVIIRRNYETTATFACRVVREYPEEGGAEAMLEYVDTRADIGALAIGILERLADAASYDGVLAGEFYRARSGRLTVFDVNPRMWGALGFPERLGLHMADRAVADVLGLEPRQDVRFGVGTRYHNLRREAQWVGAHPRQILSVVGTCSLQDVWDLPSVHDPVPDVLRLARILRMRWRRSWPVVRASRARAKAPKAK